MAWPASTITDPSGPASASRGLLTAGAHRELAPRPANSSVHRIHPWRSRPTQVFPGRARLAVELCFSGRYHAAV